MAGVNSDRSLKIRFCCWETWRLASSKPKLVGFGSETLDRLHAADTLGEQLNQAVEQLGHPTPCGAIERRTHQVHARGAVGVVRPGIVGHREVERILPPVGLLALGLHRSLVPRRIVVVVVAGEAAGVGHELSKRRFRHS